jgi:hypothetical protein
MEALLHYRGFTVLVIRLVRVGLQVIQEVLNLAVAAGVFSPAPVRRIDGILPVCAYRATHQALADLKACLLRSVRRGDGDERLQGTPTYNVGYVHAVGSERRRVQVDQDLL